MTYIADQLCDVKIFDFYIYVDNSYWHLWRKKNSLRIFPPGISTSSSVWNKLFDTRDQIVLRKKNVYLFASENVAFCSGSAEVYLKLLISLPFWLCRVHTQYFLIGGNS